MQKSKKVRMPAGIRNKLMAAVAMLLVSSIMMVSSTYAWFTLSTAPEVTGITTSVGANGNLEMALLTTETYANMGTIQSSVGDSSAVKAVNLANVTWGNLIDLSAAEYGLTGIALNPAALAVTNTTTDEQGKVTTTVNATNPLLTAEYGADGRVATTNGVTVSAVSANGAFTVGESQTYGVRAVGVASNLSVREIALRNAKSVVNTTINAAKVATKSAIYNNMDVVFAYALDAQDGKTPTAYDLEDLQAFLAIANGVISDLNTLENGYRNAAIAYAAAAAADDEAFATAKTAIEKATLTELAAMEVAAPLKDSIATLVAAQVGANSAKTTLTNAVNAGGVPSAVEGAPTVDDVNGAIKKLVDDFAVDEGAKPVTVHIAKGAVGELGAQVGTFEVAAVGSMGTVYAGAAGGEATGKFSAVVGNMTTLNVTGGATAASNITDTYGYIIDFAFRTNAADSFLQLQTAAVNRVYTDQTNAELATQGSGSNVTYTYTSGMTADQVNALLGAIRLVFLSTADGTVYATAGLTDITVNSTEATANVELIVAEGADANNIVALNQNEAKAVSVLVYLDGNSVDNADVANATSSGTLNMNLQFSSSAELVPMQNTALEQLTAYTVSYNANGGTGTMRDGRGSGTFLLPTSTTFTAPEGKVFDGWSTTANDASTKVTTVTQAATVYALWKDAPAQNETPAVQTYTVTLKANYPDGIEDLADVTRTVNQGEEYTLTDADLFAVPVDGTNTNTYSFAGWGKTADATEYVDVATETDNTLYAIWTVTPVNPAG